MSNQREGIVADSANVAVRTFFERLGRDCAAVDYDSAETMIADDVASFGTRAPVVTGRKNLRREQWQNIWGRIRDFDFDLTHLRVGGDDRCAWGMAPWTSTGFDAEGEAFDRPGRATVVLERRDGVWWVVHTHFSLVPGTPPRTFGPARDDAD